MKPPQPPANSPAAKFYEARPGFANYYFNRMARDKLLAAFAAKTGDFSTVRGDWSIKLGGEIRGRKNTTSTIDILEKGGKDGPKINAKIDGVEYELELLKSNQSTNVYKVPEFSGGALTALFMYRQIVTAGTTNVSNDITHGGIEPFYLPTPDKSKPDYSAARVDCEVLHSKYAGFTAKWYFSPTDQTLIGGEVTLDREEDPCELFFSDYKKVDDRLLPHRIEVRYGDKTYAVWTVDSYKLNAAK